jgi:hypothetical protein
VKSQAAETPQETEHLEKAKRVIKSLQEEKCQPQHFDS